MEARNQSAADAPRRPLTKRCPSCGYRLEADLETCPLDGSHLPQERPEFERVGPYLLLDRIGSGGMGAVYRALNQRVGRTVALKTLHRSLQSDPTSIKRFFCEARAVNTIRHPNVVEVYDLASVGDDHYMVMEFLRGRDLHAVLQSAESQSLPAERVVQILEQVLGALYAAHLRNIVHRDLKPANVFLARRQGGGETVKLLDFGVAKLERERGRLTAEGVTVGTPEYMAPEQARGGDVDSRSDVYAIGCIAYQMLSGRLPIVGASVTDTMVRQLDDQPQPLRAWVPGLPAPLEAAVMACLEKEPKDRPANAMELAQRLAAAVDIGFDTTGAFTTWRQWECHESITLRSLLAARTLSFPAVAPKRAWRKALVPVAAAALAGGAALVFFESGRDAAGRNGSTTEAAPAPSPPALVQIVVRSTPEGAEVRDEGGARLGTTPLPLTARASGPLRLSLHHQGFRPAEVEVPLEPRSTFDVALVPVAGGSEAEPLELDVAPLESR